jgi:hypothetical protein
MRGRWIIGPLLALALGVAGLLVGLQTHAPTALGAQSDAVTATGTPARGGGKGGKADKGAGAKANAVQDLVAALQTGDCRKPDEPAAFTLASLAPQINDAGTPAAQGALQGKLTTSPLITGTGAIQASFDSLVNPQQPYVLVVHAGKDATGPAVACGEVAGVVAGGQLALALRPVGNNDYAGLAVLTPTNDGGTAGVVFVFADVQGSAKAEKTPEANAAKAPKAAKGGGGNAGGGGGGGRAARGQSGGGGGRGGQGVGPSGGVGPAVTGGIGQGGGQAEATRTPRARRTTTAGEQPAGTPPAATTAPEATTAPTSAPTTEGTPPAATETTGVDAQATVSAIETATIATVAPTEATAEPTVAASDETQPTAATSDVVAPTEAPAETAPETSGTPGA